MSPRGPGRVVAFGAPVPALVLALVLALAGVAATAPATARSADAGSPPTPILDRPIRGSAALAGLTTAEVRTVASRNEMSVPELRELLEDPTAGLSREGKAFYVEMSEASDAVAPETTDGRSASALTLDEAFALHSKEGSQRTIYLDFDGHALPAQNGWTDEGVGTGPFAGSFGASDPGYVEAVWRIVAEKFAPFDVDVTTQEPPAGALDRSNAADPTYGSRAVFTDDEDARPAVCGPSTCAGIAFIDTFDHDEGSDGLAAGYYEPAWIFTTTNDISLNARQAAETAAHEIGHNLALEHDRTISTSYYPGHNDWYPLMGSSTRPIGQWDDSSFPGAYTTGRKLQTDNSDIAMMGATGLPTRADDVPTPQALGDHGSYDVTGIIETRQDTDVFTIDRRCTDPMTVSATGIGEGQALDIQLTITDPSGDTTTLNPPSGYYSGTFTGMDASTTMATPGEGLWTLAVDGVGGTGYSDYGSLGQYRLEVSGCPTWAPQEPPTATATVSGQRATVRFTPAANPGRATLTGWTIRVRRGTTTVLTTSAAPAATAVTTPTLAAGTYSATVTASYDADDPVTGSGQVAFTIAVRPSAPRIGTASSGASGGAVTATARWIAPVSNGYAPITGYRVYAYRLNSRNQVVATRISRIKPATSRSLVFPLPAGRWKFRVRAVNRIGWSSYSPASRIVRAR